MTKLLAATVLLLALAPAPGSWSSGPALSVARSEVAVVLVSGANPAMFVIGGYANGNVDQSLVEVFDVDRGIWHDVAPLPRGLNHIAAVGCRGKVYTFGGFAAQNNAAVANADVFDPSTNRWTPIAPLPHALGSVSVAVLGDEIHLIGGRDVHSVQTHLVYDPATNRYASRAPLAVGRDHMGLVAYDGSLYAIGGRIDTPANNTAYVDIYDPRSNAWRSGAAMPSARSGMAVALYHGKIFAIGGEQRGMLSAFTTNEAYDPETNRWAEYAPLPEGRHGTGAAVTNGEALHSSRSTSPWRQPAERHAVGLYALISRSPSMLDDHLIELFAFGDRIENDHRRLAVARIDADRDAFPRTNVQAARTYRANRAPMPILLEPFLKPVAKMKVADAFGGLRIFFGNALFEAALADKHEAAALPFGANFLHDGLLRLYRLQYSKDVPVGVFDVCEYPTSGISCFATTISPPFPVIDVSVSSSASTPIVQT